jgi:hypothetical protein
MHSTQSRIISFVAIAQFVPLVLFPWNLSVGSAVAIAILLALSGFLGWALMRRKAWGRTLTIFVQGFNAIVRIITLFANVYQPESGLNVALLATYVASVALSIVLLSYIDRSDVQLAFEA